MVTEHLQMLQKNREYLFTVAGWELQSEMLIMMVILIYLLPLLVKIYFIIIMETAHLLMKVKSQDWGKLKVFGQAPVGRIMTEMVTSICMFAAM